MKKSTLSMVDILMLIVLYVLMTLPFVSCKDTNSNPTFVSVKIHVDYQRLIILYPDFPDTAGLFGSWVGMQTRVDMTLESPNFFSADARTAIDCQMDGQRKKYWVCIQDSKLAEFVAKGQGIIWVNGVQLVETGKEDNVDIWIFYVKDGQVYAQ